MEMRGRARRGAARRGAARLGKGANGAQITTNREFRRHRNAGRNVLRLERLRDQRRNR